MFPRVTEMALDMSTALGQDLSSSAQTLGRMLANPEREIYVVTGKVEYLQEVVDFLMVHESVQEDVEESPETGSLL